MYQNTHILSYSIKMNNINQDPIAQLLSLPTDFSASPMTSGTTSSSLMSSLPPSSGTMSAKRQSSVCSLSSDTNESSSDTVVCTKKSRLSLDDKDQKTKERILRNRAAAQESRDKKRKYVSDLENTNKRLTEENETMSKKMKALEHQNVVLSSQLMSITRQLANLQAQIKFNAAHPILFDDFCDSARIAKKERIQSSNETSKEQQTVCV